MAHKTVTMVYELNGEFQVWTFPMELADLMQIANKYAAAGCSVLTDADGIAYEIAEVYGINEYQKQITEALVAGRLVYVTDGTVTRRVMAIENGEALRLDNGRCCWMNWEDFKSSNTKGLGLMDSADGLYIAPLWWIALGG